MTTTSHLAAAPLIGRRCNPYGAETGGPARVLGGLHGPGSAKTPDMGLPEAVAQGEWKCPQLAAVRCYMICGHGHRGQVMELCSWHDEPHYTADYVAGKFRQVSGVIRVRGHFEEIQKRQAGSCPRCMFPGDFAAAYRESQSLAWEMAVIANGAGDPGRLPMLSHRVEQIGIEMDEARAAGIIHNCPLLLVPVS